ncbi:phosphate ABC transporter permease PstA [bacterium]|nr:phosphate ABC transporter permease PstA [bacterium]
MNKRILEETVMRTLMKLSTLLILSVLVIILITILVKGLPALDLAMITQSPKGGFYLGKEGGILNAIIGSLYLAGGSTLIAVCLGLPIVLYLNIFARPCSRLVRFIRFSLDVLWGIPSIVYGAFGFTLMLFLGLRASLLGGIIAVTFLILPIMCRTMDEVIRMVPRELLHASYALGATRFETAFTVVVRQALPGIMTAVLLSLGRGIGDAASVLFTAGFTDHIPDSLLRPAATLPLVIFFQLSTPFPEVQNRAYASALVLTVIILAICLTSRALTGRYTKHTIK